MSIDCVIISFDIPINVSIMGPNHNPWIFMFNNMIGSSFKGKGTSYCSNSNL
jgi:hypothetical protein